MGQNQGDFSHPSECTIDGAPIDFLKYRRTDYERLTQIGVVGKLEKDMCLYK